MLKIKYDQLQANWHQTVPQIVAKYCPGGKLNLSRLSAQQD